MCKYFHYIILILLFKQTHNFPNCLIENLDDWNEKADTSSSLNKSFGDPNKLEEDENEEIYSIEKFSLQNEEEKNAGLKEAELIWILGKTKPFPISLLYFCKILEEEDGNQKIVLLYLEKFKYNMMSNEVVHLVKKMPFRLRIRFYSSMVEVVKTLHYSGVAHCNLRMNSFVSHCSRMSSLKLDKLRYIVDPLVDNCSGNSQNWKSYDTGLEKCNTPKNVVKSDIWNMGLIILLLEAGKSDISFESLVFGSDRDIFNCFFEKDFGEFCSKNIQKYIRKVISKSYENEKGFLELFKGFEELMMQIFVGCEERISSYELFGKLNELSFREIAQKVSKNGLGTSKLLIGKKVDVFLISTQKKVI